MEVFYNVIPQLKMAHYPDDTNIHSNKNIHAVEDNLKLIMILTMQLHGSFKMARDQTRKSIRLWSLVKQKISYSLNQVILISELQK